MELSQYFCASVSKPWYVYPLVVAQDPLGTLMPPPYIVAAFRAPLRCHLGTLGPWGFRPGLFGLGPQGFCPGLFTFGSQGLCLESLLFGCARGLMCAVVTQQLILVALQVAACH